RVIISGAPLARRPARRGDGSRPEKGGGAAEGEAAPPSRPARSLMWLRRWGAPRGRPPVRAVPLPSARAGVGLSVLREELGTAHATSRKRRGIAGLEDRAVGFRARRPQLLRRELATGIEQSRRRPHVVRERVLRPGPGHRVQRGTCGRRSVEGSVGRRAVTVAPRELRSVRVKGASPMANLIYSAITSLDGYVADEEVHAFVNDLERPIGTYLYGRRMYEVMTYWETAYAVAGQPPSALDYAEIWQAADKVVYFSTLVTASTVKTRIERDFDPEDVRDMKASADRDLSVGGPGLAARAIEAGLVDEFLRFITPIVV